MTAKTDSAKARFLADPDPPICKLTIEPAFNLLTDSEKLYAHWVGRASWAGARIIADQVSAYGVRIGDLLIAVFGDASRTTIGDLAALKAAASLDDNDWTLLLEYASQALSNLGNYRHDGRLSHRARTTPEPGKSPEMQ